MSTCKYGYCNIEWLLDIDSLTHCCYHVPFYLNYTYFKIKQSVHIHNKHFKTVDNVLVSKVQHVMPIPFKCCECKTGMSDLLLYFILYALFRS